MGAAVAAMVARRERDVVKRFSELNAVSPDRAVDLDLAGIDADDMGLRRLRSRAVIREPSPGLFYLDLESWEALRRARHRMALVMIALVLGMLLYVLAVRQR